MAKKKKLHLNALDPGFKIHWYEIDEVLGQGGFGITYLAHDLNLEHEVAIKEYMPIDLAVRDENGHVQPASSEFRNRYHWGLSRFLDEARTIGSLKHPNIVRVRNVFEANNTAYMVMDYELGESLQDILSRRKTLAEEDIETVIAPVIEGMRHVHACGFIHRDIKPANIFIRMDGDPVLLDFGSARQSLGDNRDSLTSIFSRGYAPIEQYNTTEDSQGPWTDIYSLGATLYRTISGIPPTDAVDRSAAIIHTNKDNYVSALEIGKGNYSEGLLQAIDEALQFKYQDRPQSIAEWHIKFGQSESDSTLPTEKLETITTNVIDCDDDEDYERDNTDNEALQTEIDEAESGDPSAMSKLAFMYAKGIGVKQNEVEAIKWYLRAAESGHLNSQFSLGVMYAKGSGVKQDYNESFKWYMMAAEQDDPTAQATVAMMYNKGIGVAKDEKEASKWYYRAALQGHTNSQYILANMLARGIGVPKDDTEAFEWYKKAADAGHINAQMNIGYMYGKGTGVTRDDEAAFKWFSRAAEQGNPNAQFNLGVIYAKGRGIKKDIELARQWYQKAAAQGLKEAVQALEKIKEKN